MATNKDQLELLYIVWDCAKEILTQQLLYDYLILARNIGETTAWYMAVENGGLDIIHKLQECAKGMLSPEDLNNKFFSAKD
jgi:hypothetical protein